MIKVQVVTTEDNLDEIVMQINRASWDEANEISTYDVEALKAYLERQDTVFLACYDIHPEHSTLLGIASSRIEVKPYGRTLWLYVDEVDVCANHRQKGAGTAIMKTLIGIANERGCEEVWLGTEVANTAANALYRSLNPSDIAQVLGYTYDIDDDC